MVFFERENDNDLHDYEQDAYKGLLTGKEYLEALKDVESDRTPGTDSLSVIRYFGKTYLQDTNPLLKHDSALSIRMLVGSS